MKYIRLTQAEESKPKSQRDERPDYEKEASFDDGGFFSSLDFAGADGLVVAFAVVGVFLVVAWIAAFPVTVYKALSGKKDYQSRHLLSLHYNRFSESHRREGELMGLRHSWFLTNKNKQLHDGVLGFSSELGQYAHDRHGAFWMLGPSFLFGFDMGDRLGYFKLDTMGGSSFDSRYGLISKAEGSFNVELTKGLSIGLGMGWIYLDRKEEIDQFTETDHFSFLYGTLLTYLY